MKTKAILVCSLLAACLAITITACYKKNTDYNKGTSYTIKMQNSTFSPASLSVPLNSKITWTNNDNIVHTVTATDGSFNSGDIAVDSSYSITFNTAGMIRYQDSHNNNMAGLIVVTSY